MIQSEIKFVWSGWNLVVKAINLEVEMIRNSSLELSSVLEVGLSWGQTNYTNEEEEDQV